MSDRVKILGYGVDSYNFENAIDFISSHGGQIVTLNPEMIENANNNPDFASIIKNAELVVPDGIGVELGLKILGYSVKRIAGIELGKALIYKYAKEGKKVAMIGAKPEIISSAIYNLKMEIPNINIVYSHDGYFDNKSEIIAEVVASAPDLILVALGSPKQEFFINDLKLKLPNSVMIGLGGSFDVWAGVVERAPIFYRNLGLEWLYRTFREPKRFKRIFPTLPKFVLNVILERLCKR